MKGSASLFVDSEQIRTAHWQENASKEIVVKLEFSYFSQDLVVLLVV